MNQQLVINILLIISSLIGILASIIVYRADKKIWGNRFLALILFFGAIWSTSIFLTIKTANIFIGNFSFMAVLMMITFANLYMISTTPNQSRIIRWCVFLPGFIFSFVCLFDSLISKTINVSAGYIQIIEPGPLYKIFSIFTIIYLILYAFFALNAYLKNQGTKRLQVLYIIIGTIIIALFGLVFNLILPLSNIFELNNLGPVFGVFTATAIAYAATKHYIYDKQVVFSEIWSFLLVLISIVWLLTNLTIFNYILFLLVLSICILFIRSVISEADKKYVLEQQKIQLMKDKEELQKLDKLKDEFLRMAQHELNSPLAVIEGKLSMIVVENMGDFSPKQREYLKPIFKDSQRLAQLSNALIEVVDIDQGNVIVKKAPTDLKVLVKETAAKYILLATEKGLGLDIHWPNEELPLVEIDAAKIKLVLSYLLENAIKFTARGKIEVEFSKTDENIVIHIKDTGIGIATEDQLHIFEKFYQPGRFDSKSPREQQGTGLHLYIAKSLTELNNGRIELKSDPNIGSTFSVFLPLPQ